MEYVFLTYRTLSELAKQQLQRCYSRELCKILDQAFSPVNLRWKWPNLEQIATEGFFALTG